MRNLKKVLSVLLVVAMLATSMVTAFAAETISADAKVCADIGMLIGAGDGVTAEYTATSPSRIQAAVMLLRLKGKAADAAKFEGTDNFADVKGDDWFAPYTAYLKANPSVGFIGVEDGKFAAEEKITAQQYYKVILTALGYEVGEGKDYLYDNTISFAAEKGLKKVAAVTEYTVNDLAIATVEGLVAPVKGGTKTLIASLVEDAKVVDAAKAKAAGIYNPVGAVTMSATVAGKAKFNVAFNQAVDSSKATITVKKGSIAYNTKTLTWAEDKKSVVVEMASSLTKGDYVITVAGLTDTALTATVAAEDQKVAKISFVTETAVISRTSANDVSVSYKVFNQYNEDVTTSYSLTATSTYGTQNVSSGSLTITNAAGFKAGDKIAVSLLHVDSGSFVSAVLTAVDKAQVADVAIKSLVLKDGKDLDTSKTASDYKLEVEFKDQYGNVVKVPADVAADIIVTVSDPSKVSVNGGTAVPGTVATPIFTWDASASKMYLQLAAAPTLTAGTSKVTFISKTTGKLASFDIVVKETAKVDVLTISAPDLAVAGEKVKIPFTAVDQFGNAITSASALNDGMTSFTSSVGSISFVQDYVNNKADLVLDITGLSAAQTVVITGITKTNKLVQLTVSAVAPRKPVLVSGIASFTANFAKDATASFTKSNVVVKDQYGRDISTLPNGASIYDTYTLSVASNSANVTVTGGTYINSAVTTLTFTGAAKGSATITLKLDGVAGSEYVFTAKTVDKADIVSYEVADIAKLYATSNTAYAKAITVNGVLADGSKVVVPSSYYTVTVDTSKLSTSVAGKVYAPSVTFASGETEKTLPVIVTVNGATTSVLTKNVVVTNAEPVPTTLTLVTNGVATVEGTNVVSASATGLNVDTLVANAVKNVDQYGVEKTADLGTYTVIVTNLASGKTIAGVNGAAATTVVAGDTFTVTAITSNGLVATFKVILK